MALEHSGTKPVYRQESPVMREAWKQDVVVFSSPSRNLWCCGKFPTFAQFPQARDGQLSLKLYAPGEAPCQVALPLS